MSTDTSFGLFNKEEWLRYTRHIQLSQFGSQGQLKLKKSHVVIIGAGGLGCPAGLYLAAAGVGRITIVDADVVDLTNLQRQIAYTIKDLGQEKASCLAQRMLDMNDQISVTPIFQNLTLENAEAILADADIVLDCTDNFATRYLINDTCHKHQVPWVMASIGQYNGQASLFSPKTGCFRCIFPEQPQGVQDCNSAGVLGVLPGQLALLQTTEALKYLVGLQTPLEGHLLLVDALEVSQQKFKLAVSDSCILCNLDYSNVKQQETLNVFYALDACDSQVNPLEINANTFNAKRSTSRVIDVRSEDERESFHIGGEHIELNHILEGCLNPEPSRDVIFYCQSGARSLKAAKFMASLSETNHDKTLIYSLQGGLKSWLHYQLRLD
jgi:sulfur-carrier protein adenylyltransferase/sulfurtransferase